MQSHLGMLMENFGISGKDLAAMLHIDSSLVSKWRSGKRLLRPNSVYTNQIIRYAMELDRAYEYARLRMLMSEDYVNIFKVTASELSMFLKDWLTAPVGKDNKSSSYFDGISSLKSTEKYTTYSLQGERGRYQAAQLLLRYARQMPSKAEIWLYTNEVSALGDDESFDFAEHWITGVLSVIGEGCSLKIIHSLNRSYETLAEDLINWLPVHMTGRTEAFFIPHYKEEKLRHTYILLKDQIAVYDRRLASSDKSVNTFITYDAPMVKDVENIMTDFFGRSIKIFRKIGYGDDDSGFEALSQLMQYRSNHYYKGALMPSGYYSQELVRDILKANGLSGKEIEKRIDRIGRIGRLGSRSDLSIFLSLEFIERRLESGGITIYDMSFFSGRNISVGRDLFIRMISEFADYVAANDNVHICVYQPGFFKVLTGIEAVFKESYASFGKVTEDSALTMYTDEMTTAMSLYKYFEDKWNSTPYVYRDKAYVLGRVRKIIDGLL
jgi:transcriptional regulator with XRE-family HTH domain